MASIAKDPNGTRRILFTAPDRKRKTIRFGKTTQRAAKAIKTRVEQILAATLAGQPLEADTARWIGELPPALHEKLAAVGLIAPKETSPRKAIGAFLDEFVEKRIDVKGATKEVWGQVVRNLKEFFGKERPLDAVTPGDAEDFKMYLIGEQLAPTTVHKRLQFARMFFLAAKRRRMVAENPFAEVSAKSIMRVERLRFITPAETARLLEACPNHH